MGEDAIKNALSASWEIIKDSAPNVSLPNTKCNAVPDVTDWQNLSSPHMSPKATRLIRNISPLGFTNVDCELVLNYQYGSTYKGGGAFIPACWVTVTKCEVAMFFSLNVSLEVISVSNANPGTKSPIAELTVQLTETISNHLSQITAQTVYTLFGDGSPSEAHH
jgi:hypothetical protein